MKTCNQNLDYSKQMIYHYISMPRKIVLLSGKIDKKDVTMWTLWVTKLHSCIMDQFKSQATNFGR